MSANTGLAPVRNAALGVATKVYGEVITSSPGPMPSARRATSSAAVPLVTQSARLAPTNSANLTSNWATLPPSKMPQCPERSTSSSSFSSR